MKRIIPSLLLLPLLTSCVVQEGYYAPGYYPPPPPPPYVEVHRYEVHPHAAYRQHGYRPAPGVRVHQEHGHQRANVHPNAPANARVVNRPAGRAVVANPHQPQQAPRSQQAQPRQVAPAVQQHAPAPVRPNGTQTHNVEQHS